MPKSPNEVPQKRRLTPRALLEIKRLSCPQVHPDGHSVAFVLEEADFEESRWNRHIWLAELWSPPDNEEEEPDENVRQLTFAKEGEREPRWSPDGRYLAFLSERPEGGQEEDNEEEERTSQIWILPLEGGEAFRLTQAKEGVESYAWFPDAETLLFLTAEPKPEPIANAKRDYQKQHIDSIDETEPRPRKQFWRIHIKERKPQLLFTADPGVESFALSPDGTCLCYITNRTGDPDDAHIADIYLLTLPEEGEPAAHLLSDREGGKYHLRWSPDGHAVTFLGWLDPKLSYSRESLFGMRIPAPLLPPVAHSTKLPSWLNKLPEAPEYALLTDYDFDLSCYEWSPKETAVFALANVRTGSQLLRIDGTTTPLPAPSDVPRFELALQPEGGVMAWIEESAQAPPEIYLYEPQGPIRPLTKLNAAFTEEYLLPKQEVVRWKSFDGLEIEGVLTYPLDYEKGKRYPLLLLIHGGPKGCSQNSLRSYGMHPVWASEGYLVLRPNYRGSEGYGNAFAIANRRDLGGGDYKDIMAGVEWCIAEGLADPERMGVMGGSYGGYMTNWIIAHTNRFKAAISLFGIFHLQTDFSNSSYSRWDYEYLGAYYWEDPEIYRRLSPGTYVDRIQTPTLIIHGEEDDNTFISNSKEMYQALKHRKVPVQFVRYPREGHGLDEPNHRLDEMRRCLAWMAKYIEGQPSFYRVGDTVKAQGMELCVTKAERTRFNGLPKSPNSLSESPTLLEVSFTLHSETKATQPLRLPFSDIRLVSRTTAEIWKPFGVPLEVHGVRVLVEGEKLRVDQHPNPQTGQIAFAVALAFAVPARGGEALLHIADMPPVLVEWPSEEHEEAES
jgi:dipeptidyl aminopeptidase/acylaminoacyl peptidase